MRGGNKWLAQYIGRNGEGDDWVIDPRGIIKKATLTFVAMFFCFWSKNNYHPKRKTVHLHLIGR